ncbi:MAG: hypothetical protein IKN05_11065 [Clostridia bacterium]|nr:hypothetical protein [Clostridia bacterium]
MVANIFDYKGKRAHFIGIGGSSMSGLAGYLHDTGYTVTGSDRTGSHRPSTCSKRASPYSSATTRPTCAARTSSSTPPPSLRTIRSAGRRSAWAFPRSSDAT